MIGVTSIVLSILCFTKNDGTYVLRNYYGGDAYTGIQHAAAETGENVRSMAKINRFGFGSVLLVGGLALIVCGLPDSKKEKKEIQAE